MTIKSIYHGNIVFFESNDDEVKPISPVPDDYNKEDTEWSIQETIDFVSECIWYGLNELISIPQRSSDADCNDDLRWWVIPNVDKKTAIKFLVCMGKQGCNVLDDILKINESDLKDFNQTLHWLGYDVDECHQMIRG